MSVCNYTQPIPSNQCIGDSLKTFNRNFSALDEGLCSMPDIVPGNGTGIENIVSDQGHYIENVYTKNSFVDVKTFDYQIAAVSETAHLANGIQIPVTTFPYTNTSSTKPLATFSVVAPNGNSPQATVYWMAEGINDTTVYALNSASSFYERGTTWFNDSVTALHKNGNLLYVGGKFTTVGGVTNKKFAIINVDGGSYTSTLGNIGSLVANPLASDLGDYGTVNCIAEAAVDSANFLIIGGTFSSDQKGKSLLVYNTITNESYPFYVNGSVNAVSISGSKLYIGGHFDYINYGATSDYTPKQYTNGVAKISLGLIEAGYPNKSVDESFCTTARGLFYGPATVNAIAISDLAVFLGGDFKVSIPSNLKAQNLTAINTNGNRLLNWGPLVGGPVFTLLIDGNYLYVGGDFNSFYHTYDFYSSPRVKGPSTEFNNAMAFRITNSIPTIENAWKPSFNGIVTTFASSTNHIYCYGTFKSINNIPATYVGAVTKASAVFNKGSVAELNVHLQTPPDLNNTSFLRYGTGGTVLIGGNFTKVNSANRFYLARVSGVGESLTVSSLSSVFFDFGGQITSNGMRMDYDLTDCTTVRISAQPEPFGVVTEITFPVLEEGFKNMQEGQMCNFFIRRPGNSDIIGQLPTTNDTFKKEIKILGIKLNFNKH